MSDERTSSYSRIVKTTSILGGSSVVDIMLRMIRTKILAMFLGPAAYGTLSLYSGLVDMVGSVSSLGIGDSAVREIAKASASNDMTRVARASQVLQRVVWGTGSLGFLVMVCLAYPASWWTFDNDEHVWAIGFLGISVLFAQINAGQVALLSGLRLIADVARVNVFGSLLATLMAVPIIVWLGENGVVPFLSAIALGQLIASWWYVRKKSLPKVAVGWRETLAESSDMLRLGVVLMISAVTLSVTGYFVRLIIQRYLGEASVGLYQASYTISGLYIGFILRSMSGDYFPRLTQMVDDKLARNKLVNEQLDIALLVAVPGLVGLLVFADQLLWLLYSDRFVDGTAIFRWLVLGMLAKIISWPMGFILMARADKKAVGISEILIAFVHLGLVWFAVRLFGIGGAGIGFCAMYVLHILLIFTLVRVRHEYTFMHNTLLLIYSGVLLVLLSFATAYIHNIYVRYAFSAVIFLYAIYWSIDGFIRVLGKDNVISGYRKVKQKFRLKTA